MGGQAAGGRGGPGRGGLCAQAPALQAGSPDHAASRRKPQGSPGLTRERRLTRGGDRPGAGTLTQRRRLVAGLGGEGDSQPLHLPCLPTAPNSIHSKCRPVSLKWRFRTCRPDAAIGPVSTNILGLPAFFRLVVGALSRLAAARTEPAGRLVREREQGVWKTRKEGKWRTLPVSRRVRKGPSRRALRAGDWQVRDMVLAPRACTVRITPPGLLLPPPLTCQRNDLVERSHWEIRLLGFEFYLCTYQLCGLEHVS